MGAAGLEREREREREREGGREERERGREGERERERERERGRGREMIYISHYVYLLKQVSDVTHDIQLTFYSDSEGYIVGRH